MKKIPFFILAVKICFLILFIPTRMRATLLAIKIFCLSPLILTSCVTDVASRYYANQQYAPKPVEQVELLRGRPSKPFDVIADFQSRGESYESMRKRAAQIGADAIIITNLGGYASLTTQWAGDDPYSHYYSRLVGTVIKYK